MIVVLVNNSRSIKQEFDVLPQNYSFRLNYQTPYGSKFQNSLFNQSIFILIEPFCEEMGNVKIRSLSFSFFEIFFQDHDLHTLFSIKNYVYVMSIKLYILQNVQSKFYKWQMYGRRLKEGKIISSKIFVHFVKCNSFS